MRRLVFLLIPLVLLGSMIAWRLNTKKSEAAAQVQQRRSRASAPRSVAAVPAVLRDITHTYSAVGTVEAPLSVQLAPKITGRLEFLEVREGDPVRKGQVLARIDSSQVEAEVRKEQANVAEARSRLAQAQITQNPTNVAVDAQIRQQEAALASAQADFRQAQQSLVAQKAAAQADVDEAESRIKSADAAIASAQASVRSAQANLANARTRYQRVHNLYKQGFIAAQDVDDASAAVKVQQGALEVAEGQLENARAQRAAAVAQKRSAEEQARIVATKGTADVEAARARVVQAESALRTARANRAQTSAYRENLAALRSAVSAAEAALRSAEARRADTVLLSPIDGVVTERRMDPGAIAGPSQPLLTVQSIRQVWVAVSVPEEVFRSIRVGQEAEVAFDALPDRKFRSRVSRVDPAADPVSRQFRVRLTLDNPEGLIKPGMFGRATFVTERVRGALVVPREAVTEGPDGHSVVVVKPSGETERRVVQVGASDPQGFQILEGLRQGEKVVTLSASRLRGGETVQTGGREGRRPGGRAPAR